MKNLLRQENEKKIDSLIASRRNRRSSSNSSSASNLPSKSALSLVEGLEILINAVRSDHNYASVSLISMVLGAMIGVGGFGIYISGDFSSTAVFTFLFSLGVFHMLEYLLTAITNRETLRISSFLFSNNGYKEVILAAFLEYWLERYFGIFQSNRVLYGIGLICVIVGQSVRAFAILTAGKSFSHEIVTAKGSSHLLVTHGIYSLMRHPSYFGFMMWSLGSQIMMLNPLVFIVSLVTCFRFFKDRIEYEESLLVSFFEDDYRSYQKTVWSGIPFIL